MNTPGVRETSILLISRALPDPELDIAFRLGRENL
jgi:hypothetical protein